MEFTSEIKKATSSIYNKVSKKIPEIEWATHAPYIYKINKLKKEKNAVILAHNYQTPEIYHGISDFSADSLALAVEAAKTKADIIVMCGVHFMAETAKLMSPEKKVLLPDMNAGCSLSSSITGDDARNLILRNRTIHKLLWPKMKAALKALNHKTIADFQNKKFPELEYLKYLGVDKNPRTGSTPLREYVETIKFIENIEIRKYDEQIIASHISKDNQNNNFSILAKSPYLIACSISKI